MYVFHKKYAVPNSENSASNSSKKVIKYWDVFEWIEENFLIFNKNELLYNVLFKVAYYYIFNFIPLTFNFSSTIK